MTITCEDLIKLLSDFIDGTLEPEVVEAAQAHLATCQNCSVVLDSTQRTILLYRERGQTQQLTGKRHEALFNFVVDAFAKKPQM